jgi:plastocyanin
MKARYRLATLLCLLATALTFGLLARTEAASRLVVRLVDECDPSFNVVIGPGTCNRAEGTPFGEFIAEFQEDRAVGDWAFDPEKSSINAGAEVSSLNIGGETHTFTQVNSFGNGFIPLLNGPDPTVPVPECAFPGVLSTFVPAGEKSKPQVLSPGTHKFQCCIHRLDADGHQRQVTVSAPTPTLPPAPCRTLAARMAAAAWQRWRSAARRRVVRAHETQATDSSGD